MRKITEQALNAFVEGRNFKKANMEVAVVGDNVYMYLHQNCIAKRDGETVQISNAGWESPTTKERLNALTDYYGEFKIYQKNYVWYWGMEVFPNDTFVTISETANL